MTDQEVDEIFNEINAGASCLLYNYPEIRKAVMQVAKAYHKQQLEAWSDKMIESIDADQFLKPESDHVPRERVLGFKYAIRKMQNDIND